MSNISEPIPVTYPLLMAIAQACDIAKESGHLIYVCREADVIKITTKYPDDRKNLLAKCWPGGRRQLMVPIREKGE